jgi:hypothetical protein
MQLGIDGRVSGGNYLFVKKYAIEKPKFLSGEENCCVF